ncbi:hypothetical protein KIPB_007360, partial [Kipferlia bialata]
KLAEGSNRRITRVLFSADRRIFAYQANSTQIVIHDTATLKMIREMEVPQKMRDFCLSPKGTFVCVTTYAGKDPVRPPQLFVIEIDGERRWERERGSLRRFAISGCEKYLTYLTGETAQVYRIMREGFEAFGRLPGLPAGYSGDCLISAPIVHPTPELLAKYPSLVKAPLAIGWAAKGSKPGRVRVYSQTHAQKYTPENKGSVIKCLVETSFPGADSIDVKWSPQGCMALASGTTDFDSSKKSYYGSTYAVLLDIGQREETRVSVKGGICHFTVWAATPEADVGVRESFVTITNSQPPECKLWTTPISHDRRPKAIAPSPRFDFGTTMVNEAHTGVSGRIVHVAGFGAMSGEVAVYQIDGEAPRCLYRQRHPNTTRPGLSRDDRFIMHAVLSPRLTVDNGVTITPLNKAFGKAASFLREGLYSANFLPTFGPCDKCDLSALPVAKAHSVASAATTSSGKPSGAPARRYIPPSMRHKVNAVISSTVKEASAVGSGPAVEEEKDPYAGLSKAAKARRRKAARKAEAEKAAKASASMSGRPKRVPVGL